MAHIPQWPDWHGQDVRIIRQYEILPQWYYVVKADGKHGALHYLELKRRPNPPNWNALATPLEWEEV